MTVSKQKLVEQAMSCFDYDKVRATMHYNNWEWATLHGLDIPTVEELKATSKRLLEETLDSDQREYQVGTGGFYVEKFTEDDGEVWLYLRFILEETEAVGKIRKKKPVKPKPQKPEVPVGSHFEGLEL